MKASEFCDFFEFTFAKEKGFIDDDNPDGYDDLYEGEYNYVACDNEGVFHKRHAKDLQDISDWFSSCIDENIDEYGEYGFVYPNRAYGDWEYVYEWMMKSPDFGPDNYETRIMKVAAGLEPIEEG